MEFQHIFDIFEIDETVDLAIRVTGDISQSGCLRRHFIQALNRDDGEELLDGPEIGNRLKHREIADVF